MIKGTDRQPTILVVDDAQTNRALLRKVFEAEYTVLEAADGAQALKLLRKNPDTAALLLDITMPEMDGWAVLERMQRSARLKDIPVIVITGSDDTQTQIRALSSGAIDVIAKPFNPAVVHQRVSNQIRLVGALRLARQAAETERSLRQAETDPVTGLLNKAGFIRRVAATLRRAQSGQYVLVRWDIDNFKVYNDEFGLKCGDEFLRRIGRYYQRERAGSGAPVLVCRYEADHFLCLQRADTFEPEARLTALEKDIHAKQKSSIRVKVRAGLYPVSDPRMDVSLMCDRALLALKSTKGSFQKSWAWFEETMRDALRAEQEIVGAMVAALDNREFCIYLQPQYNHETKELVGAEALARWIKPDGTVVPPNRFIPIFERNGFIYELDQYIWEETCLLLRRWLDRGLPRLPVSVNVSRYDVMQPTFFDTIVRLVRKYRLPTELLRLEITESAFAQNSDYLIEAVGELRKMGFCIEIDDFGSGYSSFNTLKDVPADIIKLDMRFLQGDSHKKRGGTILESIVRMAHWLNMPVIAEGVETSQQADFLLSIGCLCIQGYLYSKPVPAQAFEALLAGGEKTADLPVVHSAKGMSAISFWNPASIDSLLFSSYVGPACVLECQAEHLQIIRVNEAMRRALKTGLSTEDILKSDFLSFTAPEAAGRLLRAVLNAGGVGESFNGLFPVTLRRDTPVHTEYLRYTGHIIAKSGRYTIVYLLVENITEQHLTEKQARESAGQLALLGDVSQNLLCEADAETNIQSVLHKLLRYFDGGRIYIFELDRKARIAVNTYELCAPGVAPEQATLQRVPLDVVSHWLKSFQKQDSLYVAVDELGEERAQEKDTLRRQGIHALIAVPIRIKRKTIGFLGVDDPKRHTDNTAPLTMLGNYLATMLAQHKLQEELLSRNEALRLAQQQTDDILRRTPGGIFRFRYDKSGMKLEYASDGVWRMLGYDPGEVDLHMAITYDWVHPDDVAALQTAAAKTIRTGAPIQAEHRLRRKDGSYLWVCIAGTYVATDPDSGMLYGSYSDVSQTAAIRQKLESVNAQLQTVFNALPGGVVIFKVEDGRMLRTFMSANASHILGYAPGIPADADMALAARRIHPDDLEKASVVISAALAGSRIRNVELRVLPEDGSQQRWVRLDANPVRAAQGELLYYGLFTDITDTMKIRLEQQQQQQKLLARYRHELAYVERTQGDELVASMRVNLNLSIIEENWVQSDFATPFTGRDPRTAFAKLVGACVTDEARGKLAKLLNVSWLLQEFRSDNTEFRLDYQRYTIADRAMWVSTVIHMRLDPESNHIKAFIYTYDIDARWAPIMLVKRILATQTEFLGLIDVKTGFLHRYHAAETGTWAESKTDAPYGEMLHAFIARHVDAERQAPMRQGLAIHTVVDNLASLEATYYQECWINAANGRRRLNLRFLWLDKDKTAVILTISDVTAAYAQQQDQRKVLHQALSRAKRASADGLTGLLVRSATEQAIGEKLRCAAGSDTLALLLLDLDDLKSINDCYGHIEGDRALCAVAQTLQKCFRDSDIIGRIGGDEFMVLLPQVPPHGNLDHMAERFIALLGQRAVGPGDSCHLSCSIGIALGQAQTHTFQKLYAEADMALYHVKQRGKGSYAYFTPGMADSRRADPPGK